MGAPWAAPRKNGGLSVFFEIFSLGIHENFTTLLPEIDKPGGMGVS